MKKSSPNVVYKELLKNETKALVIEHELHDVTTEMIDWWWDNMDNDTYQLWHPEDHLALEWQIPPDKVGHAGAIHMACEKISDVSAQILRIRWEEPESAPISTIYSHVNVGSPLGPGPDDIPWDVASMSMKRLRTEQKCAPRLPFLRFYLNNS